MLLQIPFFFSFYRILSSTIELRQAPFALWIQDLSLPDPFYITPVFLGIFMLVQQKFYYHLRILIHNHHLYVVVRCAPSYQSRLLSTAQPHV